MRVRLTTDLTRYNPKATAGQEGDAGRSGMGDRFAGVRFDTGFYLDVLWKGLDVIDPVYLAKAAEDRRKREEGIARSTNVVLRLGPRGGFQSLSYILRP